MTAHEPPHLARALLDLGRQFAEERQRREQAEAELAAARKVLGRYGKHPESCPKGVGIGIYRPPDDARCTCGIDAALRRAGEGA